KVQFGTVERSSQLVSISQWGRSRGSALACQMVRTVRQKVSACDHTGAMQQTSAPGRVTMNHNPSDAASHDLPVLRAALIAILGCSATSCAPCGCHSRNPDRNVAQKPTGSWTNLSSTSDTRPEDSSGNEDIDGGSIGSYSA